MVTFKAKYQGGRPGTSQSMVDLEAGISSCKGQLSPRSASRQNHVVERHIEVSPWSAGSKASWNNVVEQNFFAPTSQEAEQEVLEKER